MAHNHRTPKAARGRGTKPERKAQRRAAAEAGQGPVTPARSDYAGKDAAKRRLGPRRLGPHTIDAPGGKSPTLPGSRAHGLGQPSNPKGTHGQPAGSDANRGPSVNLRGSRGPRR